MNTELKINENECRNRNKCRTSGRKIHADLIKMYNGMHKAKCLNEIYIHTYMHFRATKGK